MWRIWPTRAVRQGKLYDIPAAPYNWIARHPSINRLPGFYWLAHLAYPDLISRQYLEKRVREFYALFYHTSLGDGNMKRFIR
ncbi:periplasmic-binding protein [Gracilinema caldarium]|uniref:Periplasmic binding protein n=1 Tax=Gracilinema caldarium (strain ATCC 51460 / DSM 7334 / H1) TaxID=744872 RepID=F8F1A6_GRAC1|nr:periplasmic-binding protein [Gracilinema caldarium]AEJ18750.1 periplasmic binding protein [Gracilinema caldarium DSM 7334]